MSLDVPAGALASAARRLVDLSSLEETLDEIARAARTSVPGADHVGVTLIRGGRPETVAASSGTAQELDELQYTLGEGPCLDAIETDAVVHVVDVRDETRWPAFLPAAARRGLRSQIGVRLYADGMGRAGLNIYSEQAGGLTERSVEAADLLAAQAALALAKARAVDQLQEGMRSRQRIGVAVGILMHRYAMSEERAFAYLVRESSHSNTKVREVAAEVVRGFTRSLADG